MRVKVITDQGTIRYGGKPYKKGDVLDMKKDVAAEAIKDKLVEELTDTNSNKDDSDDSDVKKQNTTK